MRDMRLPVQSWLRRWEVIPLIALVVLVLISVGLKKAKAEREAEWRGLTEDEARSKLETKLPSQMPDEKRSAISDKVMAKMLAKGVIVENPGASAGSEPMAAAAEG